MRAVYIQAVKLTENLSEINLESFQMEHLKKVARVKEGEPLLILNGNGSKYLGVLKEYKKKSIQFIFEKEETVNRDHNVSLALLMPKKDAFEEVVQKSIQLGIKNIHTFHSEYSQHEFRDVNSRLKTMLISGYQQSNNAFDVQIHPTKEFKELKETVGKYEECFYFTSQSTSDAEGLKLSSSADVLYLVGPEGGLAQAEEEHLKDMGFKFVNLPTPLLRTPTAVCTGLGFLISKFF